MRRGNTNDTAIERRPGELRGVCNGESLGEKNYQDFARRYAESSSTKPETAYYERPATLSLLPDVRGKRVMDAGCGPGIYTEYLLTAGAEVVAFDVTPAFLDITRERVGEGATLLQHDLNNPLDFAGDRSFHLVLCTLVLGYIESWEPVFEEFFRVVKPGGHLVFSCGHPMSDWLLNPDTRYFDTVYFEVEWKGFGEPLPTIGAYRRSLQDVIGPLLAAGFVLEHMLEPLPTEQFREADPRGYEQLMQRPSFLCVRARRP